MIEFFSIFNYFSLRYIFRVLGTESYAHYFPLVHFQRNINKMQISKPLLCFALPREFKFIQLNCKGRKSGKETCKLQRISSTDRQQNGNRKMSEPLIIISPFFHRKAIEARRNGENERRFES
jgi:hypothetical protein